MHAPPITSAPSVSPDTTGIVTELDEIEQTFEETLDESPREHDDAEVSLAPGEVSQAEIIAEGLTPELLEAEVNAGDDALYHNRTEYMITAPGAQGMPGDPNAQ